MKKILHLHLVIQQSNLRSQYVKTFGGQTMETKPYELVDAFWKNWSQSLSLFSSAGKQLEQLTLETLKQQQDALHKLTSGVDELEKELQQFTTQFNNQYTDYVKQLTGNSLNDQINEWQDKWKELSAHMQQLTVSPTKTSLSILTQTSGQFEETTKQFIEQQQLQREEAQKQLEGFWKISRQNSWNSQKVRGKLKNLFTSIK